MFVATILFVVKIRRGIYLVRQALLKLFVSNGLRLTIAGQYDNHGNHPNRHGNHSNHPYRK